MSPSIVDNSSGDVEIPEEIKKRITQARNNVTILDIENNRLNNLKNSLEERIGFLNSSIKVKGDEITILDEKISEDKQKLTKLLKIEKETVDNVAILDKEKEENIKKIESSNIKLDAREKEIVKQEEKIKDRLKKISEKETRIERLMKETDSQIEKIKAFSQSL